MTETEKVEAIKAWAVKMLAASKRATSYNDFDSGYYWGKEAAYEDVIEFIEGLK